MKAWILDNTTRVNFIIPSRYGVFALSLLEVFVQCRLNPMVCSHSHYNAASNLSLRASLVSGRTKLLFKLKMTHYLRREEVDCACPVVIVSGRSSK